MVTEIEQLRHLRFYDRDTHFSIDVSGLGVTSGDFCQHSELFEKALAEMVELENGAIANPDEQRQVGHYWLRDGSIAPTSEISEVIADLNSSVSTFVSDVHSGKILSPSGDVFNSCLLIGIGGSALGPQFLCDALSRGGSPIRFSFFDNTDPDGMVRTLADIPNLRRTLVLVISKSGGTAETRNGLKVTQEAFQSLGLPFAKHAVAITGEGSKLDQVAIEEGWLARFPMWDWVGGRTSVASAVGLLPLALCGADVSSFLDGMKRMDRLTRESELPENPAILLAGAWYLATKGKGERDMVVLPYSDRLLLFSRYLQQLVLESLGKELDRSGAAAHQGIAVYGNKGSTDQHAYVQQLRDGVDNFFAVFLEVLRDVSPLAPKELIAGDVTVDAEKVAATPVEDSRTAADYLAGFLIGTRKALEQKGRKSLTLTVPEVNEFTVGMLIALFERAVGFYASFVNINAYHQPGVEAGKKAASEALLLQQKIRAELEREAKPRSVKELAKAIGEDDELSVFRILHRLAVSGVISCHPSAQDWIDDRYGR